jgi:hypothetical protein
MAPIDARYPRPVSRPSPKKIETKLKEKEKTKEKATEKKDQPNGTLDRWAEPNDNNGLAANSTKVSTDFGMVVKGGRSVMTDKYTFGPLNISRNAHKTVTTRNTQFTRFASGLGGGLGAFQLKASGATALRDLRDGFKNGWNRERVDKAIGSSASFASVSANTAKGFKELKDARKQVKDVTQAFRNSVDKQGARWNLHPDMNTAAHMRHQIQTKADDTAKTMAKKFLSAPGDVSFKSLKGIADNKIGWAATNGVTKRITRDGLSAAKLATKTGGRFVPGANVAIAAADTAAFYSKLRDKNASPREKITAGVTAAGSVLAATNIPVVSQVGAAVSTVSSVVGAIKPEHVEKAKNVVKKLKFW